MRFGTESTHCRTGSGGRTWSTRWAAVSTIRRALRFSEVAETELFRSAHIGHEACQQNQM